MKTYFTLSCGPDGTNFNGPLTQDELEAYLDGIPAPDLLEQIPECDGFCFDMQHNQILVIEGKIIYPKLESETT